MQITIKLRLRDKHAAELNRQVRAVNVCWRRAIWISPVLVNYRPGVTVEQPDYLVVP